MAPHLALGSSPLSRRLASRVSFKQNSWTKGRRENGQQVHFYLLADVIGINDDALTTFLWMIKDHFISGYQALKIAQICRKMASKWSHLHFLKTIPIVCLRTKRSEVSKAYLTLSYHSKQSIFKHRASEMNL